MRETVWAAAIVLLAACAGAEQRGSGQSEREMLPSGFAATGETRLCLPVAAIAERRVLGRESLLFQLGDGRSYRNRLPYSCPGLTRAGEFTLPDTGKRLCRDDSVQVAAEAGPGALCGLGDFERLRPAKTDRRESGAG